MKAPSICTTPGCPNDQPCATHARKAWTGARTHNIGRPWRRLRERALRRDGWRCQHCGAPATEVDHIVPVSRGGSDELANLASICRMCHAAKTRGERVSR